MGGKSKQSQRTKNNARPSSSGRSAELLNNAVNLESWKSPGGGKTATLFPTLNSPIIDPGLSAEFTVCVKKLNKKDPITKTKALQELTELVNNSKIDDVAAALPSWAHFYKILTVDTDCKVREATQSCHGAIARVCGRRLAPVLRQVVPSWLQAQYDDHAPAQTHANNSLKATFPENKLPEVISFCKAEVMAHLLENISGSMDKTILNRIESPEERELQQQRLVASSLQGLRFLARHVPDAQRAWLRDQLAPLLAANAFWKLANSTSPQIRGAWFGALGSVVERFGPGLDAAAGRRSARVLLQAAHDHQPAVAQQLWSCLLSLMYSVPDWHKWLDKKELLTKRILDMLEKGGWGDARRLSDMLLPLLAHLPPDMLTRDFYEAFFDAFYKGLDKKNILSSKSERQYWITSLSECLRYLSIQPQDFVVEVATGVHRAWLKQALAARADAQLRTNLVKHSAAGMASLVKYWLKQSREPGGEKYDQLIRNFWQNVASTVLAQIDRSADADTITGIIDGHVLLLRTLKTAFLTEAKKPLSIKFDGDAPTATEKPAPVQEIDAASVERYEHNLNDTVEKVCCGYFEFADKKELVETVLSPLITVLNEFDDKSLYVALAAHFGASGAHALYARVLRRWVLTDTTRCKPVVDVIFLLLKHLTEEEQDAVLASFDQFPCGVLEWCVQGALAHAQRRAAAARRWLRGATVTRALLALARRLLRHGEQRARSLLFVCLSHDPAAGGDEMMISASTAMAIAAVVSEALGEQLRAAGAAGGDGALDLEQAGRVAAHLATALAAQPADDSYAALVLNLFELVVTVPLGSPRLSAETWHEVRSAVHDGVQWVPPSALLPLLARAAQVLQRRRTLLVDKVSIAEIEHMISLCPHLASARSPSPPLEHLSLHVLSAPGDGVSQRVEVCALRYDCIVGNLNCPVDDNEVIKIVMKEAAAEKVTDLTKEDFVVYANSVLFRAIYLRTMLLHKKNDDCEDDGDTEDESERDADDKERTESKAAESENKDASSPKKTVSGSMVNELLKEEYFLEGFCKIMYENAILSSLNKAYGFWVHHDFILETFEKVGSIVKEIVSETCDEVRAAVLDRLKERSMTVGYYWAYARAHFETIASKDQGTTSSELSDEFDINNIDSLTGNGFFHTLQAMIEQRDPLDQARLQVQFALAVRCLLLAHDADEAFTARALAACADCDLDPIVGFFHQRQEQTLYERSISELSWQATLAEALVARAVLATLRLRGWDAPAHHWDFATVGLCTLLEALRKADPKYSSTKVNMIACPTADLYVFVRSFVRDVPGESQRRQPRPHVLQLAAEWRDVFAPALHRDLYLVALSLLEHGSMRISSGTTRTLAAATAALAQAEWALIAGAHREHSLRPARLVAVAAAALARPLHPAYHCLAYTLLLRLARPLADFSEESLKSWSAEGSEEGEARARPRLASDWFRDHFSRAIELADAALSGHTAGEESCEMVPGSDAHALTLGCLLLAEALHQMCMLARGELQHHYIQAYRENKYTEFLLPVALRLVPSALLALALQPNSHAPLPAAYAGYFHNPPSCSAEDPRWWRSMVGAAACRGVYTSVAGFGAGGARGWWGAAGRAGRPLARLVATYVTPVLVKQQLDLLLARKGELEDTEVTVVWSSNEAMVVYRVEDRPVELWVRFEAEYPLSLPRVTAPTVRPAVTTSWIAMYIAYQNGTVLNAVKMWSSAISSKVESSPQCYVCYCHLHPSTGHLPQVRCHQCRNRFHTGCLHKWFVSSHKSNCPLCRSNF